MIYAHYWQQLYSNPAFVFLVGIKLSARSAELSDFDAKIAKADMTTGKNSISKFLIANQESLKPKELAKRIGTNVMKTVPKSIETTAIGLERG